jgi:hypothetical protein
VKRAALEANLAVKAHICRLFDELVGHDGFGTLTVELKLLRRGQKEVILHCGKQYRYVIDFKPGEGTAGTHEK